MENTLIQGLTGQMIQTRVNALDTAQYLYATHFPIRKRLTFDWGMLSNVGGGHNVAADIHADNSTIIRKARPIAQIIKGDIPYIATSRELKRKDLKEYQQALALAQGNSPAIELVNYWANDVDFCFKAVNAELEYLAWSLASNAGKFSLTPENNASFSSEFALDYQVDETQKKAFNWANSTADIIGDLQKTIADAKGYNPRFAFMNLETFYKLSTNSSVKKACANYITLSTNSPATPDLETINKAFARLAWLNGLQVVVIDSKITREFQDGTTALQKPFEDNRIILSETKTLGSTQYSVLGATDQKVLVAQRGHIQIRKYSVHEPITEVTIGEADALPVLDTAYRNLYIRTDGKSWEE